MFWIGAAPTLPGMSDRFSRPQSPSARAHSTRAGQSSPAAASITTRAPSSATMRRPRSATRSTRGRRAVAIRVLQPAPSTCAGPLARSHSSTDGISRASRSVASCPATAGTPKLLSAASWTSDSMVACSALLRCGGSAATLARLVGEPHVDRREGFGLGDLDQRLARELQQGDEGDDEHRHAALDVEQLVELGEAPVLEPE